MSGRYLIEQYGLEEAECLTLLQCYNGTPTGYVGFLIDPDELEQVVLDTYGEGAAPDLIGKLRGLAPEQRAHITAWCIGFWCGYAEREGRAERVRALIQSCRIYPNPNAARV